MRGAEPLLVEMALASTVPEARRTDDPSGASGSSPKRRPDAARATMGAMTGPGDAQDLDDLDRELLNAVQWDFPLDPRAVRGARASGSASPSPTSASASSA